MDFGKAIENLKKEALLTRKDWRNNEIFVFMRPEDRLSYDFIAERVKSLPRDVKKYYVGLVAERPETAVCTATFSAYLCMKLADGSIMNGWVPTQSDMLSEDWEMILPLKY